MKVIIHHPYGSPLVLSVSGSDTVATVKQQIAVQLPCPVTDQRLVRETVKSRVEQMEIDACALRDEMTLDEYAIPTGTAIHLFPCTPFKPVYRELH
jgi:hypothetical protein